MKEILLLGLLLAVGGGIVGGIGVMLWPPATLGACLWAWGGIGGLSFLALWIRRRASGSTVVLLPMALRLVGAPVWIGGGALLFQPSLGPYLVVSIGGVIIFLIAEVALTLRNLRRPL